MRFARSASLFVVSLALGDFESPRHLYYQPCNSPRRAANSFSIAETGRPAAKVKNLTQIREKMHAEHADVLVRLPDHGQRV
jgi:hypothetical protein